MDNECKGTRIKEIIKPCPFLAVKKEASELVNVCTQTEIPETAEEVKNSTHSSSKLKKLKV